MSTFDDSAKALAEVATTAQKGDREAVVAAVIEQGTSLLAGMPGVGAAARAVFEQVAQATSWGRMKRAAADLDAEAGAAERARRVGGIIAEMVRDALHDADGVDVGAALAALERRVGELNAAIDRLAAKAGGVVHHNHVGTVGGGGVGIVHGAVTINNGRR